MEEQNRRAADTRRMRKGLYVLPSLFTTANLAAGFYAISQAALGAAYFMGLNGASPNGSSAAVYFNHAALAIGFAVFFDGMDGAIARLTRTTSDFGKELDSLADVVTFGVAPGILAWMWGFLCLPQTLDGELRGKLIELGGIIAFAFLTAGACRLARFNITLNPQPKNPGLPGRKYFVGMPIPGGAGCLAALVHLFLGKPIQNPAYAIAWMIYIAVCAFLMVSTWRFWSSKSIDFRSRKAARLFVLIAVVIGAIWYFHRYMLFAMVTLYMLSGIYARLTYAFRKRSSIPPSVPPAQEAGK
ncbi:MAG: phosphatidylcholine/phosphatidylserine synthase [Acidobacteriota bacterium]|nr:phosphatidylcholine/phosphatidylserine synthase [Acidobacteriota bacterium]